jgi:hypothetical protein
LSGAELAADKNASANHVPMLLPLILVLPSIDLTKSSARLAALTRVHSPPAQVPFFVTQHAFLI